MLKNQAVRLLAINYMAALMRQFHPARSLKQTTTDTLHLLNLSKRSRFYTQSVGAVRYIVASHGGKGFTFAIEPIKLTLSAP